MTAQNNSLKGRFPFRLGTTSYIIPAPILPNIRYLADKVDDIELVLFESHEISNIPDFETVKMLRDIADENNLTYTVHLPLDACLGCSDETLRQTSVIKCLRIIERMEFVKPFAYVVHFHGDQRGSPPSLNLNRWINQHKRSMEELLKYVLLDRMAVETLDYPYEIIEPILSEYALGTCLDIGHILRCGYPLERYIELYLTRSRVIHLHGVLEQKDHLDISHLDGETLRYLLEKFCSDATSSDRILTLEIFSEMEFCKSMDILRAFAK